MFIAEEKVAGIEGKEEENEEPGVELNRVLRVVNELIPELIYVEEIHISLRRFRWHRIIILLVVDSRHW